MVRAFASARSRFMPAGRFAPHLATARQTLLGCAGLTIFATLTAFPARSDAQDNREARTGAAQLQDAFVHVADTVEPAVVTVTAKKTVKPKAKAGDKEDDSILDDLGFGKSRRG